MKVERSKKDFMEALHMGIKEKSKPTSRIGNEKQEGLRADELAFDPSFSIREEVMNQRVEDTVSYVYNPFELIDYILYSDTPSPVQDTEEIPEVNYIIDVVEGVEELTQIEETQNNIMDVSDIIEEYGYEDGGEIDLDSDEEDDFLDDEEDDDEEEDNEEDDFLEDEEEDEDEEDDLEEDLEEEEEEDEEEEYPMDDEEEDEEEEYPMDEDDDEEDEENEYPSDEEDEEEDNYPMDDNEEDDYASEENEEEDEDDFLFGDSEEGEGSYEDSLPVDEEFMSFLSDSFEEKEGNEENIEEINKEVVTGGYDDVLDESFNPFGEFTTQIDEPAVTNNVDEHNTQEVIEKEDDLDFVFNLESVFEENTESIKIENTVNEVKQKEEKEVTINTSAVSNTIKETESKNTEETEVVFDKGMGLVEFLRANPKIRLEKEILSYFKGEEIVSAIRAGKILRKKGKIIL